MMFENVTQDSILAEMLTHAAEISDVALTEGSFVYNALSVAAMALEDAYGDAEAVMDNAMADTCDREHLIRFAKAKGLTPRPATKAKYTLSCNVELTIGTRLTDGEHDYTVLTEGATPTAQIETEGTAGNGVLNGTELFAVDYIADFETCTVTAREMVGEDEEDTEDFRARYFEAIDASGMLGNAAFYCNLALTVDGVEEVIVAYEEDDGDVWVAVQGPGKTNVSESVRQAVEDLLADRAPLGHTVKVINVISRTLELLVTDIAPASANTAATQALITQIIDDYFYKHNTFSGYTLPEEMRTVYHDRLVGYIMAKLEESGSGVTGLDVKKGNGTAFTTDTIFSTMKWVPDVAFET